MFSFACVKTLVVVFWVSRQVFVPIRIPGFIVLHFIRLPRCYVFYKWKVCGNPLGLTTFIAPSFRTAFAHLCLCVMFWSHNVSNSFIILFVTVICDLWCYIVIVLGHHELHPYEMANLIDKYCVCSHCSTNWPFPHHSPSLQASLFPETQ